MRTIFKIILFLLLGTTAMAQQQPVKLPTTNAPGNWYIYYGVRDSLKMSFEVDTTGLRAKYPTLLRGTDHNYYTSDGNGSAWRLLVDTSGLSYRINNKVGITDTVNMLNPYHAAYYNATFDTGSRVLTLIPIKGTTTTIIIPKGSASGGTGISVLSSARYGNLAAVSGDNGSTTLFSINSTDSATRIHVGDTAAMLSGYQRYNANTTFLGNATTGSGSTIVLNGSPTLITPSISAINVSGGIAALPTGSGTLMYRGDTTSMLSPYLRKSDTASMLSPYPNKTYVDSHDALKLNIADTASMLGNYYNKTYINSNLATKLNISDTASMLANYFNITAINALLNLKLNISDTASMLGNYYNKTASDSRYATISSLNSKLNISDTASMLLGYYNKTYINSNLSLKLNYTDTASMLLPYARVNTIPSLSGVVKYTDTSSMLSNYYNKTYINSRYGNVVNTDTSFVGINYFNKTYVTTNLGTKFNITDTALVGGTNYYNKTYINSNLATKLNISDTASMLGHYAKDFNVVHIDGTETINGAKTFSLSVSAPQFNAGTSGSSIGFYGISSNAIGTAYFNNNGTGYGLYAQQSSGSGNPIAVYARNDNAGYNYAGNDGTTNNFLVHRNGNVTGTKFINSTSSDSYFLLGGGSTVLRSSYFAISDTAVALGGNYYNKVTVDGKLGLKLNISDSSGMLGNYVRTSNYGLTKTGQALGVDTSLISTKANVTANVSDKLSKSGGTMVGNLILNADPTNSMGAATKNYVDNAITGIYWKTAVKAATTGNITLSGTQTVDGIALSVGDRVLVKNQSTATQNGLYAVAGGSWTRTSDANTGDLLWACAVYTTSGGTANGGTQWTNSNATLPVIGTDNITFSQIAGAGVYTNGTYLSLTGNVFDVNSTYSSNWNTAYTNRITSATSPLSIASNAISMSQANTSTNGWLSSTDWNTFNGKAASGATFTLGSTSIALGSTTTTVAGLSSVTSTTFVGALTGNASTSTLAANSSLWASQYYDVNIGLAPSYILAYQTSTGDFRRATAATIATFLSGSTMNIVGSASTVTGAAQTAITSLGTLTGLSMGGHISMNNFNVSGAYDGSFTHNVTIGGTLGVTGLITGTLATAAQPNITSVGTLTGLTVNGAISGIGISASGDINITNSSSAGSIYIDGTQTSHRQYRITNSIVGISNAGFSIRDVTGGYNVLAFASTGEITTGTWQASIIGSAYGGSGVNNAGTLTWGAGGTLGSNAYTSTAYLPLSGGSLTSGMTLSGNNITTQWYNGVDAINVNYYGYNAASTQFRNFAVYDGKTNVIANFTGSDKSLALYGALTGTSAYFSAELMAQYFRGTATYEVLLNSSANANLIHHDASNMYVAGNIYVGGNGYNSGNILATQSYVSGNYLPLSAGSGNYLSGDLFIGNSMYFRGRNTGNTAAIAMIGIGSSGSIAPNKVLIDPDNNGTTFGGSITGTSATFNDVVAVSTNNQSTSRFTVENTNTGGKKYALIAGHANVDQTGFGIFNVTDNSDVLYFNTSGGATFSSTINSGAITSSGGFLSNQASVNAFVLGSNGSNYGHIFTSSSSTWSLGYGGSPTTMGTSVLTWGSSGQVSIPTTTASTSTTTGALVVAGGLGVAGSIYANAIYQTSDERLKSIISRNGDMITFTWKDKRDSLVHYGYSAQQIDKQYPMQVSKGETWGVNYTEIHTSKIQKLENEVAELKLLVNQLLHK